jgi:FkbM family methyltransferase
MVELCFATVSDFRRLFANLMDKFYNTLSFAGLGLLRANHLTQLQRIEEDAHELLKSLAVRQGAVSEHVKSQIGQDLFALYALGWKRSGYFVEFGATNGVDLSNTYLLEKDFAWTGILAEPATTWHSDLVKNRSAVIDFDCVWKETGQSLPFAVVESAEFSTLGNFVEADSHRKSRKSAHWQTVGTVSLNDLLDRHGAQAVIDYLSIDTEGSEFEILNAFDFSRHRFSVITCEHNFSAQRQEIYELLVRNSYVRVFDGLSRWDDWYVHASIRG